MTLMPQWRSPAEGAMWWGFDETATPKWLMVGAGESKMMLLDFADGKRVRSINPNLVEVRDDGMEGRSRRIWFEGKNPGPPTQVQVLDPRTGMVESRLQVKVKDRLHVGLSLNFMFQGSEKTIHGPGIGQGLIEDLNRTYTIQTNIEFGLLRAAPLELDNVFHDIVREEKDIEDKKTGFARLDHEWVWDKIFAKNAENGLNIYFVPVNSDANPRQNDTLIFTKGANCVIEDGKQPPIYTLAHAIGRMLGCPVTSNRNEMNHLMFWDPGVAKDFLPRSDDFIPKRISNLMNPS